MRTTPTATSHGHSRGDDDDAHIDTGVATGTPGEMGGGDAGDSVGSRSSQEPDVEHPVDGPARYAGTGNRWSHCED